MGKKKTIALEPSSPPPAAAPPQPPPTSGAGSSHTNDETVSLLGPPTSYGGTSSSSAYSYQQDEQLRDQMQGQGSSTYHTPTVTNYNHNAVYSSFGDINLRPNTGEDNWFDGEILGLALTEILKILQWSNILACAAVIILEILVAIFRIFAPARFVLGCYLAFFASLLLRVEIAQIIKQHKDHLGLQAGAGSGEINNDAQPAQGEHDGNNNDNNKPQDLKWLMTGGGSGIGSHSKIPDVQAPILRDNFGLLFHPTGKATILMLMGSMCVGQHNNILELVLGLILAVNSLITTYLLWRYPGYRRSEDIPIPKLPPEPGSTRGGGAVTPSATAWSYYENDASSLWKVTSTIAESSSVLTSPTLKDSYQ